MVVAMAVIRTKIFVQFASCGLLLLSGGVLFWAFATSVSVPDTDARRRQTTVKMAPAEDSVEDRDLEDGWNSVFLNRFQRPLYDPPVEEPVPEVKKETPPPPILIIATMPEPGGGHAMIQDDNGGVSVLPIGAIISAGGTNATLVKVYNDRVELRHEGRVITMKLKKK